MEEYIKGILDAAEIAEGGAEGAVNLPGDLALKQLAEVLRRSVRQLEAA